MAIEDLTTWTESDPLNVITVTSSSIVIDDLRCDATVEWITKDFGAAYWGGNWTVEFKFTTPASAECDAGSWFYPILFSNTVDEPDDLEGASEDFQGIIFLNSAGAARLPVFRVENGSRTTAYPDNLAWETTYYITFERDDDGGANGTGQLILRVYTGNYYGQEGATEHDTITIDCSAGEQNDFRHIMLMTPRGSGTYYTDGTLEDLNLNLAGPTYVDIAGSTTVSISATGTLGSATAVDLAGTTTITVSAKGTLGSATVVELEGSAGITISAAGELEVVNILKSITVHMDPHQHLVCAANDAFYYEA